MTEESQKSSSQSVVNLEALFSYCMGKEALVEKLLDSFEQVGPQYLMELVDVINKGDCEGVRAMCHKVRGAGAIIHAEKLLTLIAKIRQYAIDAEVDLAKSCIPDLKKAFADITEHNNNYRSSPV